jgi:hypothetical protein
MYELNQSYLDELELLAGEIQESEDLEKYLDSEEEADYARVKEIFEPRIAMVYNRVANEHPLQLVPLELILLDPAFEGLFLPKILGYSILRGEINENFRYVRPQEHFQEILMAICNSANFEILKQRIGQSIQVGFALSSDIWVTHLINNIQNKRIRYYLQSQKLDKYHSLEERKSVYLRYKGQFRNDNFQTAYFPEAAADLPVLFNSLKQFLIYRATLPVSNASLIEPIMAFLRNREFVGTREHLQILMLFVMWYPGSREVQAEVADIFDEVRSTYPGFTGEFLDFLLELHKHPELSLGPEQDLNMSQLVDQSIDDELTRFYAVIDEIHGTGYNQPETLEVIKGFYNQHEGLSTINECVRVTVRHYFDQFIQHLEEQAYPDFFEICKLMPAYMGIFANQHFNQNLKEHSLAYIQRLMAYFTDKRGKDYQDIKRFVSTVFVELDFITEKEVVEMFKTRRKKKGAV